ncbi:MAG: MFS transporter [Buchnera aphidicola (Schlechtendalia peitan)]
MNTFNFDLKEWKILVGICTIFSLRIIGMFMVLPVFSTYGLFLKDSTTFLIGVAIGTYGFFQAIFQIPYGWLSDKIGRKFVIILGLSFFFVGSCVCFYSNSIFGVILGRSLQGSGAISSVCMALLSDVMSQNNKLKAMGLLGISFGISFVIAMVMSPIIVQIFGFKCLFLVSSLLSVVCMLVACFFIPSSISIYVPLCLKNEYKNFLNIFKNKSLFKTNLNIFFLHMLLLFYFLIIPIQLNSHINFANFVWFIYLITILVSFLVVWPISNYIEKKKYLTFFILLSIFLLIFSNILLLLFRNNSFIVIVILQIFFITFSFFEMLLPVLVSKYSPKNYKGTAMAIYSISQFLGSSIGGLLGGYILYNLSILYLLLFSLSITLLWFVINLWYLKT